MNLRDLEGHESQNEVFRCTFSLQNSFAPEGLEGHETQSES